VTAHERVRLLIAVRPRGDTPLPAAVAAGGPGERRVAETVEKAEDAKRSPPAGSRQRAGVPGERTARSRREEVEAVERVLIAAELDATDDSRREQRDGDGQRRRPRPRAKPGPPRADGLAAGDEVAHGGAGDDRGAPRGLHRQRR